MTAACKFTLNKIFTILTLFFLVTYVTGFTFCFVTGIECFITGEESTYSKTNNMKDILYLMEDTLKYPQVTSFITEVRGFTVAFGCSLKDVFNQNFFQ